MSKYVAITLLSINKEEKSLNITLVLFDSKHSGVVHHKTTALHLVLRLTIEMRVENSCQDFLLHCDWDEIYVQLFEFKNL
jgi:hypothetical protein